MQNRSPRFWLGPPANICRPPDSTRAAREGGLFVLPAGNILAKVRTAGVALDVLAARAEAVEVLDLVDEESEGIT